MWPGQAEVYALLMLLGVYDSICNQIQSNPFQCVRSGNVPHLFYKLESSFWWHIMRQDGWCKHEHTLSTGSLSSLPIWLITIIIPSKRLCCTQTPAYVDLYGRHDSSYTTYIKSSTHMFNYSNQVYVVKATMKFLGDNDCSSFIRQLLLVFYFLRLVTLWIHLWTHVLPFDRLGRKYKFNKSQVKSTHFRGRCSFFRSGRHPSGMLNQCDDDENVWMTQVKKHYLPTFVPIYLYFLGRCTALSLAWE